MSLFIFIIVYILFSLGLAFIVSGTTERYANTIYAEKTFELDNEPEPNYNLDQDYSFLDNKSDEDIMNFHSTFQKFSLAETDPSRNYIEEEFPHLDKPQQNSFVMDHNFVLSSPDSEYIQKLENNYNKGTSGPSPFDAYSNPFYKLS